MVDLAKSLVGVSVAYRYKSEEFDSITQLSGTRRDIEKETLDVCCSGIDGKTAVVVLAEILDYYRRQNYYMAVRSSLNLQRYRPLVITYLEEKSVDFRDNALKELLKKMPTGKFRDMVLNATKYFVRTYKSRTIGFKKFMSKDEFLTIA